MVANTLGVSGGETMPETTDNRRVIVEGKYYEHKRTYRSYTPRSHLAQMEIR